MADIPGVDEIKEILDTLSDLPGKFAEAMEDVLAKIPGLEDVFKRVKEQGTEAFQKITDTSEEAKRRLVGNLGNIEDALSSLGLTYDNVSKLTALAASSVVGLSEGMSELRSKATESNLAMGGTASYALKATDALEKLGMRVPFVGKVFDALFATMGKSITTFEAVRDSENALRRMMGAAGDLTREFGTSTDVVGKLDSALDRYSQFLTQVGNATGTTRKETAAYYTQLSQITGATHAMVSAIDGSQSSMSLLEAAIKVARGTGQDFNEVFSVMQRQFEQFRDVSSKPLQIFSQMFYAAQQLQVPFKSLADVVSGMTVKFAAYGDNAEGALKMVQQLYSALGQISGVGPGVMRSIAEGVESSIRSMGIAQKAFLSMQTGGPGGLRGAYQIEQLLREGNIQEVYAKMRQALMQQFGRIRTVDEAARSETAAGELTRQVAFLRQGPFGQVVGTEAEAYRLLEAFQKGARPGEPVKPREEALGQAITEGNKAVEQQTTILTAIQNSAERIQDMLALSTAATVRGVGGIGGANAADRDQFAAIYRALTSGNVAGLIGMTDRNQTAVPGYNAMAELEETMSQVETRVREALGRTPETATEVPEAPMMQDQDREIEAGRMIAGARGEALGRGVPMAAVRGNVEAATRRDVPISAGPKEIKLQVNINVNPDDGSKKFEDTIRLMDANQATGFPADIPTKVTNPTGYSSKLGY